MMDFQGTYTALVTPFRNGAVDEDGFRRLVETQLEAGVAGVVPCGCTGEAATLDEDERRRLLEIALKTTGGRATVIAGTGTNSTATTIEHTRRAEADGAHAAMLITPYYNKPTQDGLFEHYRRVGEATTLPLILYNVPGRTAVTLAPDTISRLHGTGRFAAIKEAAGSIDAVSDIRSASNITILSGDDSLTVPMMALGAKGVVSVVSNVAPAAVRAMVDAALAGSYDEAAAAHFRLLPLMRAAFLESNPGPVKAMLAELGVIANELRPPLAPVRRETLARIGEVLGDLRETLKT